MKTQKMSLANIQGKLSRTEMKNIMAGSGTCLEDYTYDCTSNSACCNNKCERNGTNTGTLCMP